MKNKLFFIAIFTSAIIFLLAPQVKAHDEDSLQKEEIQTQTKERGEAIQEKYEDYLEKLHQQRAERRKEKIEIKNLIHEDGGEDEKRDDSRDENANEDEGEKDNKNESEIESRNVRAKLRGARFTYDSEENQVLLTTPSGQEHTLEHLPDQAVTRMQERGFFNTGEEIEIETKANNHIRYKMQSIKDKRFLGFFKRKVPVEVTLDDETGEVAVTEIKAKGFWGRFLNRFSF